MSLLTRKTAACRGLCSITLLLASSIANAAPASSWNSQPSWAQPPATGASNTKRSYSAGRSASELSRNAPSAPFAPGSHNVSLDVGQVFLMGDLSAQYANSIGGRLHYTFGVSDLFGFESMLGHSSHSDGKFSMTTLLTGLRANLAWFDKVVPYVSFGMGFYKPSYQYNLTNSVSPILFGIHVGPGITLEVSRQMFFGASLTFHDVFGGTETVAGLTSGAAPQVIEVGGTFTSFLLNAGYSF